MSNIIPVEITFWQTIIDQYSSETKGRNLDLSDLQDLESKLEDDLKRIANEKNIYYEVKNGNLAYINPNNEISTRIAFFLSGWEGFPSWALNIPILNCENVVLNFYKGDYTTTIESNELTMYRVPLWEGRPELEESTLLNRPVLMNMEAPFSFTNQSDNPAIFLNLRFIPSLLA